MNSNRQVIQSPDAPPAAGPYSQGIRTGNFIFLSGQIGLVGSTGKMIEGGVEKQADQVLQNLQAVLKSQNLDLSAVVKTTVFLQNMDDFSAMNAIYQKYFPTNPPARSTIQVARLPKDALIEIEAIAVVN